MIRFAMSGARGRMGQMILETARKPEFRDRIGASAEIDLGDDARTLLSGAQVVIDFSSPENAVRMSHLCIEKGIALVVGTTGLTLEQRKEILEAGRAIPVLVSPNMALGVNLLFHLTDTAVRAIPGSEVEIVELHHNQKVDSPSGTAIRLKDIVKEGQRIEESAVLHGRAGMVGKRGREIGMHAVRGGDTPGDHTVYLFLDGERIEITHRALSRVVFARGALEAAHFVAQQKPGPYGMEHVLGFKHA